MAEKGPGPEGAYMGPLPRIDNRAWFLDVIREFDGMQPFVAAVRALANKGAPSMAELHHLASLLPAPCMPYRCSALGTMFLRRMYLQWPDLVNYIGEAAAGYGVGQAVFPHPEQKGAMKPWHSTFRLDNSAWFLGVIREFDAMQPFVAAVRAFANKGAPSMEELHHLASLLPLASAQYGELGAMFLRRMYFQWPDLVNYIGEAAAGYATGSAPQFAPIYGVGQMLGPGGPPPPPVEILMLALAVLGLVHEAADSRMSKACRAEFIGVLGKLSMKDLVDTLIRENPVDPAMAQQALSAVPDSTAPLLPPQALAKLQQEFGTGSEAAAGASLAASLSSMLSAVLSPEQTSQLLGRMAQRDAGYHATGAVHWMPLLALGLGFSVMLDVINARRAAHAAGYGMGQAEPPPPIEIVMLALAVLGLVHEAADPMLSKACRAEFIGVLGKLSMKDLVDTLTRENLLNPAMAQELLSEVPNPTAPLLPPQALAKLQQQFGVGSEAGAGASLAATLSQMLRATLNTEQTAQLLGRMAQQDAAAGQTPFSTFHTAYDATDPSSEDSPSPAKAFSHSLPPAQLAAVADANMTMRQAIDTLLSVGVRPRWVLQTANGFVHVHLMGTTSALPPIYTAYDSVDPSMDDSPSPSKAFSASLPPAQLQSVRTANGAMRQAIGTLLSIGVRPRWILETANRQVRLHMVGPVPSPVASGYGLGAGGYAPSAGYATGGWFWPALAGFLLGRWTH